MEAQDHGGGRKRKWCEGAGDPEEEEAPDAAKGEAEGNDMTMPEKKKNEEDKKEREPDFYVVHIWLGQNDGGCETEYGDVYGVRCLNREDALRLAHQAALSWSTNPIETGEWQEEYRNQQRAVTRNEAGRYSNFGEDQPQHYHVWIEEVTLQAVPCIAYSTDHKRKSKRVI